MTFSSSTQESNSSLVLRWQETTFMESHNCLVLVASTLERRLRRFSAIRYYILIVISSALASYCRENLVQAVQFGLQMSPTLRTEVSQWNVSICLGHARPQKPAFCSSRRSGRTKDKNINIRHARFRSLCPENLEQFTVDHTRPIAVHETIQSAS